MVKKPAKRATLKDVAKLAGVSHPTVSRVLNHRARVRKETADRIRDAARALNYHPNRAARLLRQEKAHIVGLSMPMHSIDRVPPTSAFLEAKRQTWADFVQGAAVAAWERGYGILLLERGEHAHQKMRSEDLFPDAADGVVYVLPSLKHQEYRDYFAEVGTHFVILGHCPDDVPIHSCDIDNEAVIAELTASLTSKGVRNPLYIFSEDPAWLVAERRLSGFRREMEEVGGVREEANVFCELAGADTIQAWIQARLESDPDVDGILFANATAALPVQGVLLEGGWLDRRPLQLAGMCDRFVLPRLLIEVEYGLVPFAELAASATRLLIDSLSGKATKPRHLIVDAVRGHRDARANECAPLPS